jgi:putative zinc finger/helix-turn-helix YgiT family protein
MSSEPRIIDSEICPDCGHSQVTESILTQEFPYDSGNHQTLLKAEVPVFTCLNCSYQFADERAENARHEAICRHLGVLTPEEIVEVRRNLGMSRAQFADLTGIGPASLQRWETGALIQNRANDNLLFLLASARNVDLLHTRRRGEFSFDTDINGSREDLEAVTADVNFSFDELEITHERAFSDAIVKSQGLWWSQ